METQSNIQVHDDASFMQTLSTEAIVPNTLVGLITQMTNYKPPVDGEETEEAPVVEKKTRGRPRKVKQVEGVIKHVQSENEPEGRSISFKEQRDLELSFRTLQREASLTLTAMLEKLAKQFNLTYKQTHSLLMN